ncbi:MAG: 23S rRNA (uracil(1939)-C(5))-methyltransferase RlmD [Elusimicrobiota bacterium]|jgi:23S rRNA (uracil-5-)-methyltransferase RumA|nr:23S rRNA (uracil(1939)-C(5))-methyltransferase RlmD [Elusimicrobiota bacterium]
MVSLKNQTIPVDAEKIVFPGRSLCRCEDGIALFTEGLLAGEKAKVLVIKDKKSFREGIVKEITKSSDERIEPACPLFGKCGGCSFQNTSYANQAKLKYEYVSEVLQNVGTPIKPLLESPQIWRYRNKMEFSFFENEGKVDIGLHRKGSFDRYVSINDCLISGELFSKAVNAVRDYANQKGLSAYNNKTHEGFLRHLVLRQAQNNNQFLINISTAPSLPAYDDVEGIMNGLADCLKGFADGICWTKNGKKGDAVSNDDISILYGKDEIREKLNIDGKDYFFKISPASFFQTNSKGTELLYNSALTLLSPKQSDVLLDLYCGTGTISISMSPKVKKVIGVEISHQAVDDANGNAAINSISNIDFVSASAQDWVKGFKEKFDDVVLDPPRAGLTNEVIRFLLTTLPAQILYISCNPSTLSRDLILLKDSYEIETIIPIDMFPQTYHIETITLLKIR